MLVMIFDVECSSKTLNKTLKEWEIGGTGEGGVDVVSDRCWNTALHWLICL